MSYIGQKGTKTVIITDNQDLSEHPSIINHPDIYEIVEGEIQKNASFMHYSEISRVDEINKM